MMNSPQNELVRWLAMYDQGMPSPGGAGLGSEPSFSMTQGATSQANASDARNRAGQRLNWATRMMQQGQAQQPNFFGQGQQQREQPGFVRSGYQAGGQNPIQPGVYKPMTSVENYLAKLLGAQ